LEIKFQYALKRRIVIRKLSRSNFYSARVHVVRTTHSQKKGANTVHDKWQFPWILQRPSNVAGVSIIAALRRWQD